MEALGFSVSPTISPLPKFASSGHSSGGYLWHSTGCVRWVLRFVRLPGYFKVIFTPLIVQEGEEKKERLRAYVCTRHTSECMRPYVSVMALIQYSQHVKHRNLLREYLCLAAKLDKKLMEPVVTHVTTNVGVYYDTVGPMLPETIEILNEFYKPFVLRLHQLLGDDRFLWKDIAVT